MNSVIVESNNVGAHQDPDERNCGPAFEALQSTSQASKSLCEDISQEKHPRKFHHEQKRGKSIPMARQGWERLSYFLRTSVCRCFRLGPMDQELQLRQVLCYGYVGD